MGYKLYDECIAFISRDIIYHDESGCDPLKSEM